jgi:tetrahydromethanopterin S-methyltransferase subunit B
MNFDKIVNGIAQSGDPGAYLKQEIEEGISPITERIDRLEKKVDMLILTLKSVDESLKRLQPLYDFVVKLPFFKK